MKKIVLLLISMTFTIYGSGQIGMGTTTPNYAAMLDITCDTAGFLPPRMTHTQMNALTSKAIAGLLVYNITYKTYYYYNGTIWQPLLSSSHGWSLTGNTKLSPVTDFLGSSDTSKLRIRVNNIPSGIINWTNNATGYGYNTLVASTAGQNSAFGSYALYANSSGANNTALGTSALSSNTIGGQNTAVGVSSLQGNQHGNNSTAVGFNSLFNDTTGNNTAIGESAMYWNRAGTSNVAIGNSALQENILGSNNTAIGYYALLNNTANNNTALGSWAMHATSSGTSNVAVGNGSLQTNQVGSGNTAIGFLALNQNTAGENTAIGSYAMNGNLTGTANVAIGTSSLQANQSGSYLTAVGYLALNQSIAGENTAVGYKALFNNQSGTANVGIGHSALGAIQTNNYNTALGWNALNTGTGSYNTLLGASSGFTTGGSFTNSTAIGYNAKASASNQVRLGDDNITSLYCKGAYVSTITGVSANLYVSSSGQIMRITGSLDSLSQTNSFSVKKSLGTQQFLASSSKKINIRIAGAAIDQSVCVTPTMELPDGLVIAYSRVCDTDTVEVKFINVLPGEINMEELELTVTLFH